MGPLQRLFARFKPQDVDSRLQSTSIRMFTSRAHANCTTRCNTNCQSVFFNPVSRIASDSILQFRHVRHMLTMVTSRDIPLPVPMSLKGDLRGSWNFFKAQLDNYEVATGLDKKDESIRIATLLTIMGKDCFQVYQNLNLTADD